MLGAMIDHTGIGVADLTKCAAFYDAALGALGMKRVAEMPEGAPTDGIGYGVEYPIFWIDRFHPPATKNHTAFVAKSRAEVDAFYEKSLAAGGTDNGPPGLRTGGYPPGYYAAFVIDPEGNRMEAVFRDPSVRA